MLGAVIQDSKRCSRLSFLRVRMHRRKQWIEKIERRKLEIQDLLSLLDRQVCKQGSRGG